ncbi:hypothetical protein [Phenylobacterium sp.]|uniref:CC_3452 family protein n=1 Tax=Phenylobacterium sp. TaxID=1871053 RepID=UPI00273416DC|nr:hypothetical protein [Phenylobacterium sp.]MDP3852685.1 hypothetical protein [Phenylobacterium sp.]
MKLQTLAAACAALVSISFAAPAMAGDPITAKLQAPLAAKTKVIAGGAVFLCEGDTCVAAAPSSRTYATSTCKDLAKELGAVAAFGGERKQLDDAKLGACNVAALPATQVANR